MANFEFLNGSSQGPHNHRFKRDREKEGKGVRRARQILLWIAFFLLII